MRITGIVMAVMCWSAAAWAQTDFDPKYERDYNIFNPTNGAIPETAVGFLRWRRSRYSSTKPAVHTKCGMDAPLNPANTYAPNSPFNPANRYDPGNPVNPSNRYSPNNPFNPANQYNPDNPLNPANRYNPNTPFKPLNSAPSLDR